MPRIKRATKKESLVSFNLTFLSLFQCSLEVTVTSLHPPRLCRIAVFSIKPTFLFQLYPSFLFKHGIGGDPGQLTVGRRFLEEGAPVAASTCGRRVQRVL